MKEQYDNDQERGSFDDFMFRETMSNIDLDELSIKNEGDERIQQTVTQPNADKVVDINDHNKSLINESIFSGEEEIFAFKRAISRIYEINSDKYRQHVMHNLDTINIEMFNKLKIPKSIPPRNEKFGLSISEQLLIIPRRQKTVNIKDHHMYGYANWGQKGSGMARALRDRFFNRNKPDQ